jgi:hypothetical protein
MKSDVLPGKMAYNPFANSNHHRPASDFSMNSILSSADANGPRAATQNTNSHPMGSAINPFFAAHMSHFHPAMHAFPHPFLSKFPHPFAPNGQSINPFLNGMAAEFGGPAAGHHGPMRSVVRPAIEPGQDDVEDDPKVEIDQPDLWSEFHNNGTEMGRLLISHQIQHLQKIHFFPFFTYSDNEKWKVRALRFVEKNCDLAWQL